jgi:hypothetical protein
VGTASIRIDFDSQNVGGELELAREYASRCYKTLIEGDDSLKKERFEALLKARGFSTLTPLAQCLIGAQSNIWNRAGGLLSRVRHSPGSIRN